MIVRPLIRLTGAVVIAALLGACHAEGQNADASAGAPSASDGAGASSLGEDAEAPVAQEFTVLGADTPLGPYREFLEGPAYDFDQALAAATAATDKREALIAACMKDAGFTYHPLPYGGATERQPEPDTVRSKNLLVPPLSPDRDVVAEWGYGLDPEPSEEEEAGPLAGQDREYERVSRTNDEYLQSLSAVAQEKYLTTLSGPEDKVTGGRAGGCATEAMEAAPQVGLPGPNEEFYTVYGDLISGIVESTKWNVGADPRAVALDQEWAKCAARQGLDFAGRMFKLPDGRPFGDVSFVTRPSPAVAILEARALGEDGERVIPNDRRYGPPEGMSEEEWNAWMDSLPPLLLRAHPGQVEVALIDFDCRAEVDYMDRLTAILHDVEQAFLDENRDSLDAMKAAATRQG
jgi:hypothetical protein